MNKKIVLLVILLLFSLSAYSKNDDYDALKPLLEVYSLIRNNYVDEEKTDPDKLAQSAIKGMINSIDPFSQYLDQQAYKDMGEDTKAEFGGLGIEISIKDEQLIVVAPYEGSPPYEAGIKAGDKIMQIEGESTKGMDIMDAVHKLRGTPGTKVTISIQRGNNLNWKDYTITRAVIKIETVKSALLEDNVGYIRIVEFMGDAADKVKSSLLNFKKSKVEKLIIDLRDNPGGLLDASVKIAEYFLPRGNMIVYTKGRDKDKKIEFKSEKDPLFKGSIVLLINRGSASASEILAGALQDNKKAIVVGSTSFGKGSVQTIIPLSDNSALRLTTAQYMTPNGKKIHGIGIEPDITLEEPIPSSWTTGLYEKNYIDDYSSEYLKLHPEGLKNGKEKKSEVKVSESDIKVLFKKNADDELLDDFRKFLINKKEEIMQQEFIADREIILNWIKTSIARKQKGRIEERRVAIENDVQIKRAINILNTFHKLQSSK
ncbi:MAG: S41 family peptidase [Candidatus Goldbacteria bacterium]|nr:S41 family peptidase [Candidatus Goldiibacteriota bacterium]